MAMFVPSNGTIFPLELLSGFGKVCSGRTLNTEARYKLPGCDDDTSTNVFLTAANMGRQLQQNGEHQQALLFYHEALRYKSARIDSDTADMQSACADILFEIGVIHTMPQFQDDELSAEAFDECLDLRRACLGSLHLDVATVLHKLAQVHMILGDHQYVSELLVESLSILLCICPNNALALLDVWVTLAMVQEVTGETEDAKSSLIEIRKLREKTK